VCFGGRRGRISEWCASSPYDGEKAHHSSRPSCGTACGSPARSSRPRSDAQAGPGRSCDRPRGRGWAFTSRIPRCLRGGPSTQQRTQSPDGCCTRLRAGSRGVASQRRSPPGTYRWGAGGDRLHRPAVARAQDRRYPPAPCAPAAAGGDRDGGRHSLYEPGTDACRSCRRRRRMDPTKRLRAGGAGGDAGPRGDRALDRSEAARDEGAAEADRRVARSGAAAREARQAQEPA
jgi:hypothetical protein